MDFFSLLIHRPDEAYGRLEGVIDSRRERFWASPVRYQAGRREMVVGRLGRVLRTDLRPYFSEFELKRTLDEVSQGIRDLPGNAPFPRQNNGDFALAELCYALCRATRPDRVLETGVCYGVTTAFILRALEVNGAGELHSIDLPPLGRNADDFIGELVPYELRSRWHLYRGTSKMVLRRLLSDIAPIGLFIHDSLHTYRNMIRELRAVRPWLSPRAVVVSDDIEQNAAFAEWAREAKPEYWGVLGEENKESLLGVAVIEGGSADGRA